MRNILLNLITVASIIILFPSEGFAQNKEGKNLRYLMPIFDKIDLEKDIVYTRQNKNLSLDIYQPANDMETNRPVIILAHGGAFSGGSKTLLAGLAEALAKRGYVAVSIDYRLKEHPEFVLPFALKDAIEDTENAITWVKQNSAKYGINTNLIALGGASSGGVIANNFTDKSGLIAIINIYGSISFPFLKLSRTPTIFIHGTKDTTVPYKGSVELAKKLTDNGIFNELFTMEGASHGVMEGSSDNKYFADAVSHISLFLYKCMNNYTHPVFKPEENEINIYPEETLVLNLHRDKKDMTNSGLISFKLPDNWKLMGRTEFSANQESIKIPIKIPVYERKTNIYLFYQSEFPGMNEKSPYILSIKMIDPIELKINPLVYLKDSNHADIALQIFNPTKSDISNGKILIENNDYKKTLDFSVSPGITREFPLPENTKGNLKARVMLKNGWIADYHTDVLTLRVKKTSQKPDIDSILSGLPNDPDFTLGMDNKVMKNGWGGPQDLSAKAYLKWDDNYLYGLFIVTDDRHFQNRSGNNIWNGDSIQFALDPYRSNPSGGKGYHEIGFALTDKGKIEKFRWIAPKGQYPGSLKNVECKIRRTGNNTVYLVTIPWDFIFNRKEKILPGLDLGFSFLLNDNDGSERRVWMEYGGGIAGGKDPSLFVDMILKE